MPFPGGLAATANGTLLFSVAAAFLYLLMLERPPSWRRTTAKTLAVLLLAVLGWDQAGPAVLVAALLLSAAGDAFLAKEGEKAFLAGLGSFLAAHLAYVVLFAAAGGGAAAIAAEVWRIAAAALMLGFCVVLLLRLWPVLQPALRLPVAAYSAAILMMGISALTLPVPLVILGAALFMASDAILATERFLLAPASPHRRWTGSAVWLLYYAAQVAITLGVLFAG